MTIEEQAALYEAGVKANLETGYMGELFPADEDEADLKVLHGLVERYGDVFSSADWFGPEVAIQGYAAPDIEWTTALFERMAKADRLAAQRPLIHNGRKMKR